MSSNEQRRQAAKRKLERQLTRRVERAKRRKLTAVVITVIVVVAALVVGGGSYLLTGNHGSAQASAANPCNYTETPDQQAPPGKNVGMPPDPEPTPNNGIVKADLKTNQGDIPITLNRADAPCTVQSFLHLVSTKFFDNTPCHRLTADTAPASLKVLQCGDPTGQGSGGPGYTIPDENPKNLKPDPAGQGQPAAIYPRGTLAMANTGKSNSGGSQFFLVYGDTQLPPNYAVFGTIDPIGLSVLDKIAAGGIIPGTDPNGQPTNTDGKPKLPVTIEQAVQVK